MNYRPSLYCLYLIWSCTNYNLNEYLNYLYYHNIAREDRLELHTVDVNKLTSYKYNNIGVKASITNLSLDEFMNIVDAVKYLLYWAERG